MVYSQHALTDAPTLMRIVEVDPASTDTGFIHLTDVDSVYAVLKKYVAPKDSSSKEAIKNAFRDNPFMHFSTQAIAHGAAGTSLPGLGSIGGLDVTNIANGIAALMIERAKQELTIAFFNRFKKFSTDHPEFQVLFPKTTNNLANLLTYAYPQMLPALRNSFFQDLQQIPFNLEGVLELPKYANLLKNYPEVLLAVQSLKIAQQLQSGQLNAADAIVQFSKLSAWDQDGTRFFNNMKATVKFAAIFSESLRSTEADKNWVSLKDLQPLQGPAYANVYLGLVWQLSKTNKITYFLDPRHPNTPTSMTSLIAKLKGNVSLIENRITQFINVTQEVDKAFAKLKTGDAITNEDYYNYVNTAIDAIDLSFSVVKIFDPALSVDAYMTIARNTNTLYKDIYSKQYTQAVNDALDILTQVHDLTKENTAAVAVQVPGAMDKKTALDKLLEFAQKVKPYALFMANVADAKSSDDVKAALESVILPVGSSSIKKNTHFNLSIQSYLGAFAVTSHLSKAAGTWSDKFGVTAPIGLSLTPGFLSWNRWGSLSLFAELFDLGAIVDYQLKADSTVGSNGANTAVVSKNYSIKLGQIVSPGVYAVYGAGGNLPLAFGFGGQYGPGLSKIDAGTKTVLNNPGWRWNFFLTVDLPFFNLVNTSKEKRVD